MCGRDEGSSAGAEPRKFGPEGKQGPVETLWRRMSPAFSFPFPRAVETLGTGTGTAPPWMPGRSGAGETITTVGFDDAAVGTECTDPLLTRCRFLKAMQLAQSRIG